MRNLVKISLAVIIVVLVGSSFTLADTIYVNWDGSGDYTTIQEGIDAAVGGDEVVVADGTYTGDGNRDIDFLGKAITVRSENGAEDCIIDCEGSSTEEHRGFYFHSGEDANSVLEGFTITNGYGLLEDPFENGNYLSLGSRCTEEVHRKKNTLKRHLRHNYNRQNHHGLENSAHKKTHPTFCHLRNVRENKVVI